MSCAIHIGMEPMNFIFESMDLGIYIIQADARKKVQPCGLVVKENIQYGKDEFDNVFDVYYPESCQDKKLPTILHIHGGGYVAGSKEQRERYCMLLAKKGYCVINIEYSNAKKFGFPGPVKDAYELFNYIEKDENVSEHIDFDNFFLSGDSVGAHVATLIANAQTNPEFKKELGVEDGPQIKGCLLTSPSLKMFDFKSKCLENMFKESVLCENNTEEMVKMVDMTTNLSAKFPPTIMISAGNDFLKKHADKFCETATELQIPTEHYVFTSAKHLLHDFTINYPHLKEGQFALNRFDDFIKNVMNSNLENTVKVENVDLVHKKKQNKNEEILGASLA